MKLTRQKQLNILAERTHDLKKNVSEKDKQRRNQVVDLFGMDISRYSNENNETLMYVSVSADLIYYMRFQFKVYIETTHTLNNFKIYVVSKVEQPDGTYVKERIDITPYLQAQITDDDGTPLQWINGDNDGKAWPNNRTVDEDDPDATGNAYDLLEVASMMRAEGETEKAAAIERAEFKTIVMKADNDFFAAMILYLKYSHLGR